MTITQEHLSAPAATRDPRAYVTPEVWDREIQLLVRDNPFDKVMAERIFGQAIAYLITAMENQGVPLGVGQLVDHGVHALILDTKVYREFCAEHFDGKFLDHIPEIERKRDGTVERTARAIEANGFVVDWPLWAHDFAKCSPCAPGSNPH